MSGLPAAVGETVSGGERTAGAFARFVQETRGQTVRWMIQVRREPFSLLFALFQPLILLIFFGGSLQKLGGAISPATSNYRAFMMPGILSLTVFGNSMAGGIPLLFDKESGFLARVISAPVSRTSLFVSRFLVVNFVSTVQCLIMIGIGAAFGMRVATGLPGIAALLAFGLLLGLGVTSLSLVLAFKLPGHASFFALLSVITLPVTFLSSAFVPLDALPGWMRAAALVNPMTWAIEAMRGLVLGGADAGLLLRSFAVLALVDLALLALGGRFLARQV